MSTTKTFTLKALQVNEHGRPINREAIIEVSSALPAAVFRGDYVIVTRNEQNELIAVAVYPTFQRVSRALTSLREGSATSYGVMEVA